MTAITEYCSRDDRPLIDRFWSRLGFGKCCAPISDDFEGFSPSYITTTVMSQLSWDDRLRVLISGKVMTQSNMKTDVLVSRHKAESCISVLPPNYPMRRPS